MNEREKYLKWERLSSSEQHVILMAIYRLDTEPLENHGNYLEIGRFKQWGIKREDLPLWFLTLAPEKLKEVAYAAIRREIL